MKPVPLVLRLLVTLLLAAAAAFAVRWMWRHYQVEPWTRDGRVRADVVQIAPDVSGLVTAVDVTDNTPVRKGQRLFVLDQPRFQLALEQADAALLAQTTALAQAQREAARNGALGDLVAAETVEEAASRVAQLQAAVAQASAARDAARLNLARTSVYAPVDGVVTNGDLHPGDYVTAGRPALGVLDVATVRVEGYFEETKLSKIRIGDRVTVELVGDRRRLLGRVDSIAPGIEDRERAPDGDQLPNVNPTFSWVRLAQRIPVRVRLDRIPDDVRLIAGRTATVVVHPSGPAARRNGGIWSW